MFRKSASLLGSIALLLLFSGNQADAAGSVIQRTIQDGTGTHTQYFWDYSGTGAGPIQPVFVPMDGAGNVSSTPIIPVIAGAASSGVVLKAAPGNLYGVYVTAGAAAGWLMVFNSIIVPADGATTVGTASGNLQDCIAVAANASIALNYAPQPPEVFSTGISVAFSSTACATKTASATAFIHGSAQ